MYILQEVLVHNLELIEAASLLSKKRKRGVRKTDELIDIHVQQIVTDRTKEGLYMSNST